MTLRIKRTLSIAIAITMVASACSGGASVESEIDETAPAPTVEADGDSGDNEAEPTAPPETPAPTADAAEVAAEWLESSYGIDETVQSQLVVAEETESGGVTHIRFDQIIDSRRVRGAGITVHVLDSGEVQGANESLTDAAATDAEVTIDASNAAAIAVKAVDGTASAEPGVEPIWVQNGRDLIAGYSVSFQAVDPVGAWQVVVDGTTGGVLAVDTATPGTRVGRPANLPAIGASLPQRFQAGEGDQCDTVASPSACVFLVDPATSSGQAVDPSDANSFLVGVALEGLTSSNELVGEFATTTPEGIAILPDPEADSVWAGGVGSRNFEAAMAYYWVDTTQRLIQNLGFSIRSDAPTPIVPLDADIVDNAFFDYIFDGMALGVGSNGINAGQDGGVIIHEYGHGILFSQVGIDALQGHETSAYSEAFGDILAVFTTIAHRQSDPACIGSWFITTNDCLRRLDTDLTYPTDLVQEVHDDGTIFTGAVWDIFEGLLAQEGLTVNDCFSGACDGVRDRLLSVALGAHYYITPGATFRDIANGYLLANEAGFANADRAIFEAGFDAHGLSGDGTTQVGGNGDEAVDVSGNSSIGIDISHDFRGDLFISVGVLDANFEPLCEELIVAEADPTDEADNFFGVFDITGTDCAQNLPPSPDQLWFLFVSDELTDDRGEILEFVVFDGEDPYPSGGLPIPIPDADPEGTFTLIDGSSLDVAPENQANPGEPIDGQPFISLDITHEYGGDLFVRGGVTDAESTIICSVPIQDPDPSDDAGGLIGSVDMSPCAEFYPPTPDQVWFLQVIDTAAEDVGTIDLFSVTGPNGDEFVFSDVPFDIPDNDEEGLALLLNGSSGANGQAGGAGQSSDLELPAIGISMTHGYTGDLAIAAGVADANLDVLCEIVVNTPDPSDDSIDPEGEISLSECGDFYPPSPDRLFYVFIRDTLSGDVGTLDLFTLTGPDGRVFESTGVPIEVPDADQSGIAAFIDGSEDAGSSEGAVTASFVVSHTYVGDLEITAGVVDPTGTELCEVLVTTPDPANEQVDIFGDVDLSVCAEFYPPSPDRLWYLVAVDTAEFDLGTIDAFLLGGPDGVVRQNDQLPIAIPDNDDVGVAAVFAN